MRGFPMFFQPLRFLHSAAIAGCTFLLAACASTQRESPPEEGVVFDTPWGAVAYEAEHSDGPNRFSADAVDEMAGLVAAFRRDNPDSKLPYNLLALSGGGSRGAYGAGVLTAWSELGTRPQFDVVTGISTGALMAPAAFLGSDYDDRLGLYRKVTNEDIFDEGNITGFLTRVSVHDTSPLRELLKRELPDEMIAVVAEEHRKGRHLFIGTTNLDADIFTIWDMGKIAASEREGRQKLFRDVIMASASFPGAFPPVYLPAVDDEGNAYQQMHVDGGVKEALFLYDYLSDLKALAKDFGVDWDTEIDPHVWLINNGKLVRDGINRPVKPRAMYIAFRSVESLMGGNSTASMYLTWTQSLAQGAAVSLTYIPRVADAGEPLQFDPVKMNHLYQLGYDRVLNGTAWLNQDPPESIDEFLDAMLIQDEMEPLTPPEEGDPDINLEN